MNRVKRTARQAGGMLFLLGALACTGCQTQMAGMTLPSAYYLQDRPDYVAPGPQFPLPNELAAMKRAYAEANPQNGGANGAAGMMPNRAP